MTQKPVFNEEEALFYNRMLSFASTLLETSERKYREANEDPDKQNDQ